MNRFEGRPASAIEARLQYLDGDFKVLQSGSFVRCAVSGLPIPLEELRYWNVDLQEASPAPAPSWRGSAFRRTGRPRPSRPAERQRGARLARMRCSVLRCMLSRRAVSETLRPHSS